jgi:myosin heavy subunit
MPEMTPEEAAEGGKNLNFEKVWVIIAEVARKQAEAAEQSKITDRKLAELAEQSKETDQKLAELAEQSKETDRAVKELTEQVKETDRAVKELTEQVKETDRAVKELVEQSGKDREELTQLEKTVKGVSNNVGGLNRSMGELIEILIAGRLWDKFPGYQLVRAYQRIPIYDEKNQMKTDIDILLVNTNICMAVEVKRELNRKDDVDDHLKRMGIIRRYPPEQVGNKLLLGAMAGGIVDPDVKEYAHKSGFFVLELSGEAVHLIPSPDGFKPQEW